MDLDHLAAIANVMVADNKGLLAADESTGTIGKRLGFNQREVDGGHASGLQRNAIPCRRARRVY